MGRFVYPLYPKAEGSDGQEVRNRSTKGLKKIILSGALLHFPAE